MPVSCSERQRSTSRSASASAACASRCIARTFATCELPLLGIDLEQHRAILDAVAFVDGEVGSPTPSTSEAICARSFACSSPLPSMRSWIVATLTRSTADRARHAPRPVCLPSRSRARGAGAARARRAPSSVPSCQCPFRRRLGSGATSPRSNASIASSMPVLDQSCSGRLDPPRGESVEQAEAAPGPRAPASPPRDGPASISSVQACSSISCTSSAERGGACCWARGANSSR